MFPTRTIVIAPQLLFYCPWNRNLLSCFFPIVLAFLPIVYHLWPNKITALSERHSHISVPELNPRTGTMHRHHRRISGLLTKSSIPHPIMIPLLCVLHIHTLWSCKSTSFLLQTYFGTNFTICPYKMAYTDLQPSCGNVNNKTNTFQRDRILLIHGSILETHFQDYNVFKNRNASQYSVDTRINRF